MNVYRWNQQHTTPSMSFNAATEAEEEEEEAAVESQALPVGDSDECGPPRGCSEPMVPSLAQFTWRRGGKFHGRRPLFSPLFEGNLSTGRGRGNDELRDVTCGTTGFRSRILKIS